MPASSFGPLHCPPLGRSATSRVALATSRPTNTGVGVMTPPSGDELVATRPCWIRALDERRWATPSLKDGLADLRTVGLSPTATCSQVGQESIYKDCAVPSPCFSLGI